MTLELDKDGDVRIDDRTHGDAIYLTAPEVRQLTEWWATEGDRKAYVRAKIAELQKELEGLDR